METYSTLEMIIIGLVSLLVIFWFGPGIKAALERGKQVQSDWNAVLIPLALVVVFVLFLIMASGKM